MPLHMPAHGYSPYTNMPKVIAHRGASGHAPENTAAALQTAAKMRATWVEVDITVTSDGVAVVFHDSDVNRCTNGRGLVIKQTLAELKTLDAGSWYSPFHSDEKILTMMELLTLANQLDLNINMEIKPTIGRETETVWAMKQALRSVPFDNTLLLSSFNYRALMAAKEFLPEYPRALNVEAIPRDWAARMDDVGATGLHFALDFFDRKAVEEIIETGTPLACFTVNDLETAQRLWAAGVTAVFTDYPDRLLLDARRVEHH